MDPRYTYPIVSSTGDRGCRDVPKGERMYEDFLSPSIKGKLGLHQVEESGREALRADFIVGSQDG